jgi:hypothetical protein
MHDDDLKQLLHGAEGDLAPPKVAPAALAARVRTADRHRRRRKKILIVAAPLTLIVAFGVGRGLYSPEKLDEFASTNTDAAFQAQLLALEAEAETHAARARALMAEREAALALLEDDPLAELRENVDIVAYRMILEADELQADMRPIPAAIEIYERVIRDFPNTYSAEVAQERLTAADSAGVKS